MKNLFMPVLLVVVVAGASFAQSPPTQSAPSPSAASDAAAQGAATQGPSAAQPPGNTQAPAATQPSEAPPAAAQPSGTPPAAAQPSGTPPAAAPSYLEQELEAAAAELSSPTVGNMTMADIEKIADHLAIAVQKERYVQRVRNASFMVPGAGQFIAGDTLGGWLFVAWDVTVLAGTLVSAYFVLPSNVQLGALDYVNSPWSTIRAAWASNSIVAYLPLGGVLAAGVILETVLRHVSADNAASTARRNIAEGKVAFQPALDVMDGILALGMKMRY